MRALDANRLGPSVLDRCPAVGDPVRLRSGWINGIKSLPVSYRG